MLKDFKKENIEPCTYDLRLGELFKHSKIDIIEIPNVKPEAITLKLPYMLKPGEFVIGRTIESFDMPLDLTAMLKGRTSMMRFGLNIMAAIMDPGYKGQIVFGIQNITQSPIKIVKGMKLLQAMFFELKGQAIPVQTKYIGGKLL